MEVGGGKDDKGSALGTRILDRTAIANESAGITEPVSDFLLVHVHAV
jgi:hypothetical protein